MESEDRVDAEDPKQINIGFPAFCRRPFETKIFKCIDFQQESTAAVLSISEQLEDLVAKPEELDLSTEDISFRNTFHRWSALIKDKSPQETETDALKPKSTTHKERILKEPLLEFSDRIEEDMTLGVQSIVNSSGNALRSRVNPINKRKHSQELSRNAKFDPDKETIEDVRQGIEKISENLQSAREMVAQKNINLKQTPYRRNLYRMYWDIAKHLEECEGRVFEERSLSDVKKRKQSIPEKDRELIQQKIAALEKRVESIQTCRFLQTARSEVSASNEELVDSFEEDDVGNSCPENLKNSCVQNLPQRETVIEIQIVHPSFLKTKATDILALGSHTLRDVINLCVCSSDDIMESLEEKLNPSYCFIEGVFYTSDSDNDVLKDIKSISSFCGKHGCGWPLDKSQKQQCGFEIALLDTALNDIPLRASNKPLYLYCHHGACEHLLHVQNIRMMHKFDSTSLQFGPIRTKKPNVTIRKCSICEKTYSSLVVYGSKMNITDPCFYCDTCYYLSHFDEDGVERVLSAKDETVHVFPYRGG